MANKNELTIECEFKPEGRNSVVTPKLKSSWEPDSKIYNCGIQTIAQSGEEVIDMGDVASPGLVIVTNLDDTNYIEIGLSGSYCMKVKAGRTIAFSPTGTIYALANTADVDIEVLVVPDSA